MRVLMVTQFYPPVAGGQEQHVRNLAHALADRGHGVEVVTIAVGRSWRNDSRRGRPRPPRPDDCPTSVPSSTATPARPHAMPIVDPGFRSAIARLLAAGQFDILHAHDWSIGSAIGPARRSGVPVVLTQHDYSHVCATKRLMRGDKVCPGPAPMACVRCASSWHGPVVGPGCRTGQRARPTLPHQTRGHVRPGQLGASRSARSCPGRSPYAVIPNFIPDDLLVDEAAPNPDGPIVFVGDLSRDKGIEVLHRGAPTTRWPSPPRAGRKGARRHAARPSGSGGAPRIARSRVGHRPHADGLSWWSFPRSCPTAVRRWSSRQWPSGDRSSRPPVGGSSTWWTTA